MAALLVFSIILNVTYLFVLTYLTIDWMKKHTSTFLQTIGVFLGVTSFIGYLVLLLEAVPAVVPFAGMLKFLSILSQGTLIISYFWTGKSNWELGT